jgi:phosphoribosylamine--glycine ligase
MPALPSCVTDIGKLTALALDRKIDLTVVGPEASLCAGVVDEFQSKGLRIFGPAKRAAQLEGSKVFAKKLLLKYGVPTAPAEIFDNAAAARAYVRKVRAPMVVKADGLAAGKGVTVAQSIEEAERAVAEIMELKVFGAAGTQVIIEECLRGEELSVMALVDGQSFQVLASAQDHKRAWDADRGPNTGGMGAYSPTSLLNEKLTGQIASMFRRTLMGLQTEGIEYRGVLYAGLMMTDRGPQILEFNCRFGDPETQAVLPRLENDLVDAVEAAIDGKLESWSPRWKSDAAVCVVMASGGYPGPYERGRPIAGLKDAARLDKVCVFHAGTQRDATGQIVTEGGRVLGVTALGANVEQAARRAYEAVERIHFDGAQFRRDIAAHAFRKQ